MAPLGSGGGRASAGPVRVGSMPVVWVALAAGLGLCPGLAWADLPPEGSSRWALAESKATIDARKSASIEATVETIVAPLRGLARDRLAGQPKTCARYELLRSANSVTVRCDGGEAIVPLGGGAVDMKADDGSTLAASAQLRGGALVLTFVGPKATQTTRFVVEGSALVVTKEISSSYFSVPVRCHFRYGASPE